MIIQKGPSFKKIGIYLLIITASIGASGYFIFKTTNYKYSGLLEVENIINQDGLQNDADKLNLKIFNDPKFKAMSKYYFFDRKKYKMSSSTNIFISNE